MKKILIGLLISFGFINSSFAEICDEASNIQDRNGVLFLPNQTNPYSGVNLCTFDNEQFKTKGRYNNGLKSGLWTEWQNNGIKVSEQIFTQGELQSKTFFSDLDYQKYEKIYYSNGIENLKTQWSYHPNLQMKQEFSSKNSIFHGKATAWYENGQKESEFNWLNDKLNGIQTDWYENGNLKEQGNWKDNERDGKQTAWYENGQMKEEGNTIAGTKNGAWNAWYENSQMKYERYYSDGFADTAIQWHENGQKQLEANSKNNKPNGQQTTWYDNGQKRKEFFAIDGVMVGSSSGWYDNGQLRLIYSCKDGVPDGIVSGWEKSGKELHSGSFVDGSGFLISVHENSNNKRLEVHFKDGNQVSFSTWWENGKKRREVFYEDGEPKWTNWNEDGEFNSEGKGMTRILCISIY